MNTTNLTAEERAYQKGLDALAKRGSVAINAEDLRRLINASAELERFRAIATEFCEKVESGRARSTDTYGKFKRALSGEGES